MATKKYFVIWNDDGSLSSAVFYVPTDKDLRSSILNKLKDEDDDLISLAPEEFDDNNDLICVLQLPDNCDEIMFSIAGDTGMNVMADERQVHID